MTRSAVVARVVAASMIYLTCIAAFASPASNSARLDQIDYDLFPSLGHLLAPESKPDYGPLSPAHQWPSTAHYRLMSWRTVSAGEISTPHHVPRVPAIERRNLLSRIRSQLPRFDRIFRRAADTHNLPASLLAAQAYIESKWNPQASHRGVAGMMMMSRTVAKLEGVDNRLKASQSVDGGAAYLARMRARIDDSVPLPDRNYFALAAYNMGLAHVRDAQTLAERLGKNPRVWADVSQVVPLLAEKRYYSTLPYGYARGDDVVRYIDRVRGYESIIAPHLQ